jgi:hypothetical protein
VQWLLLVFLSWEEKVPFVNIQRFGLRGMGVAPAGLERANSGHHHLLIDTELPPLDKRIPNDFNHLHFGAGQTEAEVTLKPCPHTLQLLFGDKDHVPHNPPVMSPRIRVVVAEPQPPNTTMPPTQKFKRVDRRRRWCIVEHPSEDGQLSPGTHGDFWRPTPSSSSRN